MKQILLIALSALAIGGSAMAGALNDTANYIETGVVGNQMEINQHYLAKIGLSKKILDAIESLKPINE